ncbi:hypothetical protein AB6A23_20565 [Paenibacillus tarimensis]
MKKYLSLVTAIILLLIVSTMPIASAQGFEDSSKKKGGYVTKRIAVDSTLTIEKAADGRILPVKNAKKLSDTQLNTILKHMKVNDDLISKMPLEVKQHFVSKGGVSVPITSKQKEYFYTSDGKRLLVTDENREEINKIKQQEAAKLNNSVQANNFSALSGPDLGSDGDGTFSGFSNLQYIGETDKEKEYTYAEWFFYNKNVNYHYTDKIAHAWQSHTKSIARSGSAQYYLFDKFHEMTVTTSHEGSVTGSSASIKLPQTFFESMFGLFYDDVRIPKTESGYTGKWVVKYAHPWTTVTPSVTIGPIGISFSTFLGNVFEWENTFTIGVDG